MTPFILGGVALVVVAAAFAAFALASATPPGPSEPATQPVAIDGARLADFTDPAADAAIGQQLPTLSGVGMDGQQLEIGPDDVPVAIVVLAHWCAHCQAELPGIADFIAQGLVPEGVTIVGVSTAIDAVRPNYPPSDWFEREGWAQPTLIDDADSHALEALGLVTFPGFVFADGHGTVVERLTGEIGADRFGEILNALAN